MLMDYLKDCLVNINIEYKITTLIQTMDLAKDLHLVVIPLLKDSKRPFLRDWQKWNHEESYQFFEKPRDVNRGILYGPISDLTVINVEVDQMEHWNRFVNDRELKILTVNTGGGGSITISNIFTRSI